MKNPKAYIITSPKSKYIYGAFPRNREGKKLAKLYVAKLYKKSKEKYIIK